MTFFVIKIIYIVFGGERMDYKYMIKIVAKEFNTTPALVEKEIKKAISAAGYNISPQAFISLCALKLKKDRNNQNLDC